MMRCIWYAWPVLASGERFFEMICSWVMNCDAIMRTTRITRIVTVASQPSGFWLTASMRLVWSGATPKSFAS